jgi:hypothetical protein
MLKPGLIGLPFPSHEDKPVEHHPLAHNGDILERLFQNDKDTAVHDIRVGDPPQIHPIGIDLVIGDQDHALRELGLQHPILGQMQLAPDALVSTNAEQCWTTILGESGDHQAKVLFCICHVRVVPVLVD